MRRAPGRQMVAKGPDVVSKKLDRTYLCRIEQIGNTINYLVDGEIVLSFQDEKPLKGGYWGFRIMACAKGEYDNIKVISIQGADGLHP